MTTFLCVADIHEEERKLESIVGLSRGCDAILDCGDDLDKFIINNDESASIIRNICRKFACVIPSPRRTIAMKDEFRRVYEEKAARVNSYYKRAGIPVFATLGNHDPYFVAGQMGAVNYVHGKHADFAGLTIAGLPATGDFVRIAMGFSPEYYPQIGWYDGVESEKTAKEPSEAAKNILGSGKVDVFITHQNFVPDFHSWSQRSGLWGCNRNYHASVDAGALAVNKKFKPRLCVFGHYHLREPRSAVIDNRLFLCPGVNHAVKVVMNSGVPEIAGAMSYT